MRGELNAAIPPALVDIPPVDIVDIAWHKASKYPIPASFRQMASMIVRHTYMVIIQRAVTDIRGCSLARAMPIVSAANRWRSPSPKMGSTATVKNTIPSPPIHCVIMRQKTRLRGNASRSLTTDAPVVVNPAIVSKKASVIDGI